MRKEWFVGKIALQRMAEIPIARRLAGLSFDGGPADAAQLRGTPLTVAGTVIGRVTSAGRSPALERSIGLGWIRAGDDGFPSELRAGSATARVTPAPFYDPEGVRLRG
jgi:glycine cleavage system aminomethyltransferase T